MRRPAKEPSGVVGEHGIDRTVIAIVGGVPAGEVGSVREPLRADDLFQERKRARVAQVRIEPQAEKAFLERAVFLVLGGRPRALVRRLREPPDHDRQRSPADAAISPTVP